MTPKNSLEDFNVEEFQQEVSSEIHRILIAEFPPNPPPKVSCSPSRTEINSQLKTWGRNKPKTSKFFLFTGTLLWMIAIKVLFPSASALQTAFLLVLGWPLVYWVALKKEYHSHNSDIQEESAPTAGARGQGISALDAPPRTPALAQVDAKKQKIKEEAAKKRLTQLLDPEISAKLEEAEEIVKKPSIKKLICPAILSLANDAFEYSKVLTPILVGAVIAKTIVLPLDTLLFAAIAVVVTKGGASTICTGYSPDKK